MYSNFHHVTELELAEAYAELNDMPYIDEESLSDDFDANTAPHIVDRYGVDDQDAIDQGFNDWSDSVCKDGYLHKSQYNEYIYVGKYSDNT